jgi:hypothetical protein
MLLSPIFSYLFQINYPSAHLPDSRAAVRIQSHHHDCNRPPRSRQLRITHVTQQSINQLGYLSPSVQYGSFIHGYKPHLFYYAHPDAAFEKVQVLI